MNNISEEIKNCSNCSDESYAQKYAHYVYLDKKIPVWACWNHHDTSRPWIGILNPSWNINLRPVTKVW